MKFSGSQTPVLTADNFSEYGWYPNLKLNFAENLLKHKEEMTTAINFIHENGHSIQYSHKDLYHMSASLNKVLTIGRIFNIGRRVHETQRNCKGLDEGATNVRECPLKCDNRIRSLLPLCALAKARSWMISI